MVPVLGSKFLYLRNLLSGPGIYAICNTLNLTVLQYCMDRNFPSSTLSALQSSVEGRKNYT
jgi:hypothetical protein